ncbi:MAG TPA: hypothetical protein VID48_00205 [Solirubrobacteraceae bacterium]|jgi:hypothetical protein
MLGNRIHRTGTLVLSLAMVVIGVALIVQALSATLISGRLLAGVLFLAAGVGRMYVEARRGSPQ